MKVRVLLFAASVLVSALLPSTASAQFACGAGPGPGMRAVGFSEGGNGIAPTTMCVYEEIYDHGGQGGSRSVARGPNLPDPQAQANQKLASDFGALVRNFSASVKDPQFQKYRDGAWNYFQEGVPPKPGLGCSAMFASSQGMLSLSSAPAPGQPVVYSFSGPDVPKPKKPTPVHVTFHQSSGADMTIPVMNYTLPQAEIGSIGVMIKDMPSALRSLQDSEDLAIDLDGKRIYTLTYRDGTKMKAEVQKCMAGSG